MWSWFGLPVMTVHYIIWPAWPRPHRNFASLTALQADDDFRCVLRSADRNRVRSHGGKTHRRVVASCPAANDVHLLLLLLLLHQRRVDQLCSPSSLLNISTLCLHKPSLRTRSLYISISVYMIRQFHLVRRSLYTCSLFRYVTSQ